MDQWQRYEEMTPEKVSEELQSLNKKLFKMKPGSPMYNQMLGVINTATQVYRDKLLRSMVKEEESNVMDIGEIDSHHGQPNYGSNVLDVVVNSYVSKDKKV